jgi:serine protease Do
MRSWASRKWRTVVLLGGVLFLSLLIFNLPAQAEKDTGKKGWLGVSVQDLDEDLKEALELKSTEGVLVNEVVEDSPAEEAGIKKKDVIIKYKGKKITDAGELTTWVLETKPGEEVRLEIVRGGKKKEPTVTIGTLPENYSLLNSEDWDFTLGPRSFQFGGKRGYLGVGLDGLTEQLGSYFGVQDGGGALITEVEEGSPAEKAGLKAGDVIVKIDDQEVEDPGDVIEVVADKKEGDKVAVEVLRDKEKKSFTVEVAERESTLGYLEGLKHLKILDSPRRGSSADIRIEIDKERLEKELDKLKDELRELKEELTELKEKVM